MDTHPTWIFWQGGLSPIRQLCLDSLLLHNPGAVVLDEQAARDLGGGVALDLAAGYSWQVKADLLRLWLLREYGGQWIDADVIALRRMPLVDWLDDRVELVGFGDPARWPLFSNAILAARKGGQLIAEAYDRAAAIVRNTKGQIPYGSTGQGVLKGVYLRNRDAVRRFERWRFMRIPWYMSHLYDQSRKDSAFENSPIWNPASYCYHLTGKPCNKYKRWNTTQLMGSNRFLSFLFRKAFGNVRPARAAAILDHLRRGPLRGAALGVGWGYTARTLLQQRDECELVLVDLWDKLGPAQNVRDRNRWSKPKQKRRRQATVKNVRFARGRATIRRRDTTAAAAEFSDASFDFVYVDGTHTREKCAADIAAWLPKIKPGGLLCGHDYGRGEPFWGVRQAVDEVAARLGLAVDLGKDTTWFLRLGGLTDGTRQG